MLEDFKKFILRGNVIDLAIAVIIGAAFNQIVNSMVADVLTPLIGAIGGKPDFSSIHLGPIGIGKFINAVINFVIVSCVIFFGILKPFQKLQELAEKRKKDVKTENVPPEDPADIKILKEILSELKKR